MRSTAAQRSVVVLLLVVEFRRAPTRGSGSGGVHLVAGADAAPQAPRGILRQFLLLLLRRRLRRSSRGLASGAASGGEAVAARSLERSGHG
jgi:hypothetical protein